MGDASSTTVSASSDALDNVHFTNVEIDKAESVLSRFYCPLAVGTPDGPDGFSLGVEVIQLGPLTVGQLTFAAPATFLVPDLNAYHVCMPTTGRMLVRYAGHEIVATPTTGVMFVPGHSIYTHHDTNSAELAVKIERAALEEELSALLGHPIEGPIDLPPTVQLAEGPGQSWSRLIRLLRDELDFDESLIYQPLIAEQLRSCVLSGLLLSVPHRYRTELIDPPAAGPPRAIRRAVEAIHDEPERTFTVGDLAKIGNMSVRSLQEGFRRHVGCAPMTYLQTVRLDHARETLRRADPARVTVAAVAHRWGFAHLGRFASAYRARFGEAPSETLRAAG